MKGPTVGGGVVNFKHGGAQIIFACSACELIPYFPTVKYSTNNNSTSPDSVSNSMVLELKRGGRKGAWAPADMGKEKGRGTCPPPPPGNVVKCFVH